MYVLSYQGPSFKSAAVVIVETTEQADNYIANLPDDYVGIVVGIGVDSPSLRAKTGAMLVILHNALADEPVQKFHDLAAGRASLFRLMERKAVPAPPEMLLASAPDIMQTHDALSNTDVTDNLPLPDVTETTLADPEALEIADMYQKEADMAAKTKTAKAKKTKAPKAPKEKKVKAAKAAKTPKAPKEKKVSDGLPRAGTKKAELLRLLQRQNGATMAEMLEATGWKACLGTAKAVTEAAKLKFRSERGTDGKASRWYAE